MAIRREIVGPQAQFERRGSQNLRDIRPFTVRLAEALRGSASGFAIGLAAAATWWEPALVHLTLPLSLGYAGFVLSRKPDLPLRLPWSAHCLDAGNPLPGTRKPGRANGTMFLGWDVEGRELWITASDARQHMTLPGTTGAGKTSATLSLLTNALAQGSGFVLVDGKAQRGLFGKVLSLARRFGREDDVRVLNFMVASGVKDSHTFNPFAIGNADAIRELLVSQLGEPAQHDSNGVFRERAVALMGTIAPVLVWLRDNKGVPLNIDRIRYSIELGWIWKMAIERIARLRDPKTGTETEMALGDEIPVEIIWPLRAYLGELPGYDLDLPYNKQKGEEPSKQHGFAVFYFTAIFEKLAVSLGHIFRVDCGDVDMRDIVLNRRILVVLLPALENSEPTLAALGKLVVASLRGMMAQLLGVSLEGEYTEGDVAGMGDSPFPVVLDELAYYATTGLDAMLAQGRGLNVSFMLGFQEVSGVWARLGERTASILGNANLTIAMRQQDAGRTREWIENTAGKVNVTQVGAYHGGDDGQYREARQAVVQTVSRVDWQDLTSLIEGEAIVLMAGRRVYARLFHTAIDESGPKRIGRTVMLPQPDADALAKRAAAAAKLARRIEQGGAMKGAPAPVSPALAVLIEGMRQAAVAGKMLPDCVCAALDAVDTIASGLPAPPAVDLGLPEGVEDTALPLILAWASLNPAPASEPASSRAPGDSRMTRDLARSERAAGMPDADALETAERAAREYEEAWSKPIEVEPQPMTAPELASRLERLIARLEDIGSKAQLEVV
jgi:intracellular multiplication protein IcmO